MLQAAPLAPLRDPFARRTAEQAAIPALLRYAPAHWQMVGRMASQRLAEALLKAPDGVIYRVRVGMAIGPGHALVSAIEPAAVRIQPAAAASADIVLPLYRPAQE